MTSVRKFAIIASCLILTSALQARENQISLEILRPEPGKKSLLKLKLNLENDLGKRASFNLAFPEKYDLSSMKIAGSKNLKGGFQLSKSGQNISIVRKGGGAAAIAGSDVEIIFGTITVPGENAPKSVEITIEFNSESQKSHKETLTIQ